MPAIKYEEPAGDESLMPETGDAAGSADELLVRFLDVGQGDSALITLGEHSMLIDGGPSSASSELFSILTRLGITHLDCIIATHPDADHCGGLAGALNAVSCGTFYCSVTEHDTKTFNNIIKYLGDVPVTVPKAGDSFALGGATVEFVGPVRPSGDTNNGSLVCELTYGDTSFLFTGDAEVESEAAMLASGVDLSADVLKVGHHGSGSSTSQLFLDAVSPDYAVISVGKNSYGHPTDEVLSRLQSANSTILRTDELGDITFASNGTTLTVTTSKDGIAR